MYFDYDRVIYIDDYRLPKTSIFMEINGELHVDLYIDNTKYPRPLCNSRYSRTITLPEDITKQIIMVSSWNDWSRKDWEKMMVKLEKDCESFAFVVRFSYIGCYGIKQNDDILSTTIGVERHYGNIGCTIVDDEKKNHSLNKILKYHRNHKKMQLEKGHGCDITKEISLHNTEREEVIDYILSNNILEEEDVQTLDQGNLLLCYTKSLGYN